MRNEIYARHGHRFPTAPDLQQHFDAQAWYQPRKTPTPLTAIEQLNVQIIQAEEADRQKLPTYLWLQAAIKAFFYVRLGWGYAEITELFFDGSKE